MFVIVSDILMSVNDETFFVLTKRINATLTINALTVKESRS